MSRTLTAMIAATAIVLPSLAQFANAAPSSSKVEKTSNKSKASSKKASATRPTTQSSGSDQVDMADCDLDGNGVVDVNDIMLVLNDFNSDCRANDCLGDVNHDQLVDVTDILAILANYGTLVAPQNSESPLNGVRACLQSSFSSDAAELNKLGVRNDCWMVHGYAVEAPTGSTEEEFFSTSVSDVEYRFGLYLSKKTDLTTDFEGMVILDIESPFHPRHFGKFIDPVSDDYNPEKFEAIVEGYKLRIAVVREMLPNCKLGIYGFPTPHPHGKVDSDSEQRRILGYEMAAARGVFDQIDVIVPVIYQRFGPSDSYYSRMASYTAAGIEVGRSLRRSDGTAPEMQPLMSFKVYNGPSAHNQELIAVSDLADQVEVLRELGVEEFMFWNGKDALNDSITITERLAELKDELEYRSENVMVADGS